MSRNGGLANAVIDPFGLKGFSFRLLERPAGGFGQDDGVFAFDGELIVLYGQLAFIVSFDEASKVASSVFR